MNRTDRMRRRLGAIAVAIALAGCSVQTNAPLTGPVDPGAAAGGGGGGAAPNRAPVISSFSANPGHQVEVGQAVTFTVVATDDQGDTLQFVWSAPDGTLSSTTGTTVTWLAPDAPGTYAVMVTISDAQGASVTGSQNIRVRAAGAPPLPPEPSATPEAPAPSPTPAATPSPSPTPTASPKTRSTLNLMVDADRHTVFLGPTVTLTGQLDALDKAAVDLTARNRPFVALLGAAQAADGWRYARIETLEEARAWVALNGGAGPVTFVDSMGGDADNAGAWTFGAGDTRFAVEATEHLAQFPPSGVAYIELGDERTWTVSSNQRLGGDATGPVLVYSRPDNVRDFVVVNGETEITAHGWAYAFYLGRPDARPQQKEWLIFKDG